ncbi:MAG TPA: tyrosine-type recombinase/integrase [Candidatus Marinimicrobia bacterium]|nr:tyrosine-type recombinase/integrase [Candidatus Neomarinimicrobiota bacterium]
MAGLRILKGKFYVRVWIDGKEKLLPTGTANRRDAEIQKSKIERQELEIRQKIRDEIETVKNRLTIKTGIDYFLKNVGTERNITESTVKSYTLAVNDFINSLGRLIYFDSIQRSDYSELLAYLQSRYNPTTVNIRLRGIRAMLNYLVEKGMIRPPFNVKMIKTDRHLPKFITPDEMDAIYRQVTDKKLLSTFKIYEVTGLRASELFHSKLQGDFITVEKSKARKQRIIPIPFQNITDYQIATTDPYSVSFITHSFTKAAKQAGITGKTLHALRHTFALRKLIETNNIQLVKELLGHSSVSVTEIYTAFPVDFLAQVFKDRSINAANYRPSIQA